MLELAYDSGLAFRLRSTDTQRLLYCDCFRQAIFSVMCVRCLHEGGEGAEGWQKDIMEYFWQFQYLSSGLLAPEA